MSKVFFPRRVTYARRQTAQTIGNMVINDPRIPIPDYSLPPNYVESPGSDEYYAALARLQSNTGGESAEETHKLGGEFLNIAMVLFAFCLSLCVIYIVLARREYVVNLRKMRSIKQWRKNLEALCTSPMRRTAKDLSPKDSVLTARTSSRVSSQPRRVSFELPHDISPTKSSREQLGRDLTFTLEKDSERGKSPFNASYVPKRAVILPARRKRRRFLSRSSGVGKFSICLGSTLNTAEHQNDVGSEDVVIIIASDC